ncbi:hypothetical protein [Streptomyces albiflavescens]|nr:hypothetical protein [Streptomyces albiflavescens]
MAAAATLDEALHRLAQTPYRLSARTTVSLPEAQRAVTATLLWHLRVLAGWLPRGGARLFRPLAAGFEIANVASRLSARSGTGVAAVPARCPGNRLADPGACRDARRPPCRARGLPVGDPGAETPWALITDGTGMLRDGCYGPRTVVGSVAVLSVDAWRVRAAVELAARGGRPLEEFDALV